MKTILKFTGIFILSTLIVQPSFGQKLWGFVKDKDGEDIVNEELIIEVQICKNGDSLFTKKDTIVTKTLGAFESDLTAEFEASDATNKDTISYALKFIYEGETIESEKKVWHVQLKSRSADHASQADNSVRAEVADFAIDANHALTAIDAENAFSATNAINAQHATNSMMADWSASTMSYPDLDLVDFHGADEAFIGGVKTGNQINYKSVPIPSSPGSYDLQVDESGSLSFEANALANIFNSANPGNYVIMLTDTSGNLVSYPFVHNQNTTNLQGQLMVQDNITQAILNYLDAYGGMFIGAVCADNFFQNKSPILNKIEKEKSIEWSTRNTMLWESEEGDLSDHDFHGQVRHLFPDLIREVPLPEKAEGDTEEYVDYTAMIPLLSKVLSEQQAKIDKQETEIEELKKMVLSLLNEND